MFHALFYFALTHLLWSSAGLLFFCKYASARDVWNMPWPVAPYHSYMDIVPMRFDSPAGLTSLNFSFSAMKTKDACPGRDIYIIFANARLPLVDISQNSLPEYFVEPSQPGVEVVVQPGQMAEVSLIRPPPGPWYIGGYLRGIDQDIRQKGLNQDKACRYLYMFLAKLAEPVKATRILPGDEISTTIDTDGSSFSFTVSPRTVNFEVQVMQCKPGPCNISLSYLSFISKEVVEDCSSEVNSTLPSCALHISSPPLNDLHIVKIKFMGDDTQNLQKREVVFKVLVQECLPLELGLTPLSCGLTAALDRVQSPFPQATMFSMVNTMSMSLMTDLMSAKVIAIPFTIKEPNDVGGTLKWEMHVLLFSNITASYQQVCGGLIYNKLPDTSLTGLDLCSEDIPGAVNLKYPVSLELGPEKRSIKRYVPYPQTGQWFIVLQTHCFADDSLTEIDCGDRVLVEMLLEIQRCVDTECSGNGRCDLTTRGSDFVTYSACVCDAEYRGYGCTDGRYAQSTTVQLAGAYLLTLSNLAFVPAIILSIRRGFFVEAFVYFYNMFFSTFYHACDGMRIMKYRLCITHYDVLQLADFFGSACSLWFTVVAMACIKQKHATGLLQIVGSFCLFVAVVYDRTHFALIASPIFSGLVIIGISWGLRMYRSKQLYPSWRRYVFFLVPGVMMAILAGACFTMFETKRNYKYLHSLWHTCIATSIVLLLPPKAVRADKIYGFEEDEPSDRC